MRPNKERVGDYLGLVPLEMREAVSGLSSDTHWAVFIALLDHDMRFTELESMMHDPSLGRVLDDLICAGLVQQYATDITDIGVRDRALYRPTAIGKDIMGALLKY